jgi:hypothetical protein
MPNQKYFGVFQQKKKKKKKLSRDQNRNKFVRFASQDIAITIETRSGFGSVIGRVRVRVKVRGWVRVQVKVCVHVNINGAVVIRKRVVETTLG